MTPADARPPGPQPNPWRTLRRRQVYANPWIRVREDAVVRPDGSPGVYGVVELANLALGVVPLFADGDTVLVGQHRYPLDRYSWEIPEGGGSPARPPLEEIRRELREETGLLARSWTELGVVHTSNSVTDEVGLLWLAEDLTQRTPEPEGSERLQLWRLPFDDALDMALRGGLTDSLTVAGLCRAAHVLRRRGSRVERAGGCDGTATPENPGA